MIYLPSRILVFALCVAASAVFTPGFGRAEEVDSGQESSSETAEELKAAEDPTTFPSRVWLDSEWKKYRDGSHKIEETLGAVRRWRISERQEWRVRLKVPAKIQLAADDSGESDNSGLGDIKLGAATGFRLGEAWRVAGGLEMRFPTASDSALGNNAWQPQLFGAAAWDVTRKLTLSPSLEYNRSIAEENDAPRQHFVEMFFPATWLLPRSWSVTARYEAKVDFEQQGEWTHSAKLAVGKRLKQIPLGFSLSVKKSFNGSSEEFQVNFVTTYFFRLLRRLEEDLPW